MSVVSLRPITDDNRAAILALDVTESQSNYVAGVSESLADAKNYPHAMPRYWAICADEEPVGFVMISDNLPPGDPTVLGPYFLWRLLIDARYQGRGYGRATIGLIVDYLRTRPAAEELLTSVARGDADSPMGFYLRMGFIDRGDYFDDERVMRLPLANWTG